MIHAVKKIRNKASKNYIAALSLLSAQGIKLDANIEEIIGIFDDKQLLAVGGIFKNTLRSIAVAKGCEGTGVINTLMSELISAQYRKGNNHLFIYTKPESAKSFTHFGFRKVAESKGKAVLLETDDGDIETYLEKLSSYKVEGQKIAAIVMNGNPFTKGHQYLIERASKESAHVHVFIVSEDQSTFPTKVRYRLIQEGTAHIDNISLHQGGDYIISSATFPTYFLKEKDNDVSIHAELDLRIFGEIIAKELGITHRYVGEENYCQVTASYNLAMKQYLPEYGIKVVEVGRLNSGEKQISASHVRKYIKDEQWEKIKKIVPKTTYDFLKSKEAEGILHNIKQKDSRH